MTHDALVRWGRRPNGIVVITMDDVLEPGNMANVVDRLRDETDDITGVILTSGAEGFTAESADGACITGWDISPILQARSATTVFAHAERWKAPLRRLEQFGRPIVAAISGAALGWRLEIALACHHRVALNVGGTLIGLPEATVGLIPVGGAITRTVRMLGLERTVRRLRSVLSCCDRMDL